jgi:hypothetical protein
MPTSFAGRLTATIADFLREVGIQVEPHPLPRESFLPGVAIRHGGLAVDEERLEYPGDLLHEAGHLAVVPGWARPSLDGAIDVPGLDTSTLEWAAIPWSYAASVAIGLDPAVVFHAGGYHGCSPGLIATFRVGGGIGVHLLEEAGMTAGPARAADLGVPVFPHMLRWLRD